MWNSFFARCIIMKKIDVHSHVTMWPGEQIRAGVNYVTPEELIALYDDCREGYITCQGEVGQQKLDAMRKEPGECQMSYINIFLTGAIKTHGKLVCTSEELFNSLQTLADNLGDK